MMSSLKPDRAVRAVARDVTPSGLMLLELRVCAGRRTATHRHRHRHTHTQTQTGENPHTRGNDRASYQRVRVRKAGHVTVDYLVT